MTQGPVPRYDLQRWTPGAPPFAGQIAPNGQTWWDGVQWAPLAQPAPPAYVQAPARRGGRRVLKGIGIGCGGLVALAVIGAVVTAVKHGSSSVNGSCSPQPCAVADGLAVGVTKYSSVAPDELVQPHAGMRFVEVDLAFDNGSSDSRTVNPFDFKLKDSAGVQSDPGILTPSGCREFNYATLSPGAKLAGAVCFEIGGSPTGTSLVWDPGAPYTGSALTIPLSSPTSIVGRAEVL